MARVLKDRIEPGAWVLEQLSLKLLNVEMAAARRAWYEAKDAWPGEERDLWWKWMVAATTSIGLQTKIIDCSVREAVGLVQNGADLFVWKDEEDGTWLRANGFRQGKVVVSQVDHLVETSTINLRQLRRSFGSYASEDRLRCVVVRQDISPETIHKPGMTPFNRLMTLLRPEWSDIWIILVFAFIVGLLTLATPIAVEALVNTVAFGRLLQPIVVLALILLIFLAFSAAMRGLQTYVAELVQRRLFARVSGDLAFRLPRVKMESADGLYLPELTNRFFDIVTVQKVAASLLLDGIGLILSALIGMAVLAFYHPWLLGFDIVMMCVIAFIIFVLGKGAVNSAVKESKHKYYMAAWLEDISSCRVTFQSAGGADLALERADRLIHQYLEARQSHFRILLRQILFALGLQAIASTVLLGLGGWLVVSEQLTLGQLVAAELIVTVIVGAFAKLGKHMESFYDLLASVDKLGHLFDLPMEEPDGLLEMKGRGPATVSVERLNYVGGGSSRISSDLSFNIKSGESLALLGPSGCGKSTTLDLLFGLRTAKTGHIAIDGYDPQDLRSDVLRSEVGLVRAGEIFTGSIDENIHLHRTYVSSSDVRQALEDVGLYDALLSLPKGFDTKLFSNGSPLSSAQQNLVLIARAIASKPRLLLLDEVLDGIPDEELEVVLETVLRRDRPWSLIIATGRKSIADQCNQVKRLQSKWRMPTEDDAESGSGEQS